MSQFFYLAPEILLPFSPLTSQEFEIIRHKARALWQDETRWSDSSVTTYSGSYREKQLDESTYNRLAPRAGQKPLDRKQNGKVPPEQRMPPMRSAYNPGQAGSQGAKYGKGGLPDITRPLDMKHKVVHQVWGSMAKSQAPLYYRKPYVRPKKPGFEILMNYKSRGKNLLETASATMGL